MDLTPPPRKTDEANAHTQKVSDVVTASAKMSPRARSTAFVLFIVLLTLVFIKPLVGLFGHIATSELHSYIVLVPFVAAYLLYLRRKQLPPGAGSSPALAMVPLAMGLMALGAAWQGRTSVSPLSHNDF